LDRVLPRSDVATRHALTIAASAPRVWEALERQRFGSSGIGKLLLALRGYGLRTSRSAGSATFAESVERFGFVRLEEIPGRELVFGLAGRFWRPDGGLRRLTREQFPGFLEEGSVKAAWNLEVRERATGETELSTETRVLCFGTAARRKFRLYWTVIEPFSGLTRQAMLRGIRRAAVGKGRPEPAP
jgi:hypothetical protein